MFHKIMVAYDESSEAARGCYELCTHLDSLRGVVCC